MGEIPGAFAQVFNLSTSNEGFLAEPLDLGDVAKGMIAVTLNLDTRKAIRARWTHAIIVKVFGWTVGFHFLHAKVRNLWKPVGRLDCVDLGKDYFLIRFGLVEDYDNVIKGGPWFVGGHFLTIKAWEPNFRPSNATCNLVAVWLRLPELPFEFYDPGFLKEIGSAIGPVLQVDSQMATEARGRYARICVQVDLNKPLIRSILLEGMIQEIQYEGINTLCFSCGHVGHQKEGCPYSVKTNAPTPTPEQESTLGEEEVDVMASNNFQEVGTSNVNLKDEYGPWVLVRRKKVGPKGCTSCNPSKKADVGTMHGFVHQSKGIGSHVTSFSPKSNARGARGPVDGLRSKGNFGNTK
ncbi:uncharacterized protein LOC126691288 [Quercus robur]|uniref:uncharacterized protein LOC126691288 n=1 Tax=Quercus robur TaxID=38942 RepID=UPI002162F1DB|nr:uncharacterized protein LOC126691288 [Quercus robur]